MSRLIEAHEALDYCAQAMDDLAPDDDAREDVRAIYQAAGQVQAAWIIAQYAYQADPRIHVPDWLVKRYGDAPQDRL